jgi:hypothetical protein
MFHFINGAMERLFSSKCDNQSGRYEKKKDNFTESFEIENPWIRSG